MTVHCYGDSNTFGYDPRSFLGDRYDAPWPEALAELTGFEVRNNGSCGRRVPIRDVVFPKNADFVLVMLGTNDLLSGDAPGFIGGKMATFLRNRNPDRIILIVLPPLCRGEWVSWDDLILRSKSLTEEYRAVAAQLGIRFLDAGEWRIPLCYDGVHFTEEGHRRFAEQCSAYLQKNL